MYRIFLTREQYDLMVTRLHSWVKANWLTLDRAWTLNGVSVQCNEEQLVVLAGHVAKCGGSARVALQEQEELQDDWCNLCHNRGCYNCR